MRIWILSKKMEVVKIGLVNGYENEFIERLETWCDYKVVSYYKDGNSCFVAEYTREIDDE